MTRENLIAAIKASHERQKKRKRAAVLHITLTDAERDEFRKLCEEHGMLERELLVNSMRAFRTLTRRVELLEARLTLIEHASTQPDEAAAETP